MTPTERLRAALDRVPPRPPYHSMARVRRDDLAALLAERDALAGGVQAMSALRAFWNGDEPRRVIVQLPPIGKDGRCPRCGEEPSADTLSCGCHRPIIEAVEALDHDGCEPECPWPGEHRAVSKP